MHLGFVGLGVMGGPMANHLLSAGHKVTVWNRTPSKSEPHAANGAIVAPNLPSLAQQCDIIFLCVGRTEDLQECLDQITPTAKPNALLVDHSTISPKSTIQIHQNLANQNLRFSDAPITGGSMGAQNGTLTIFCGGHQPDFDQALPLMQAYGKDVRLVGGPGQGQTMKMANQIAVAGALAGLCESLAFAQKAGLDLSLTREMLAGGAAGSWAFNNYGPKLLAKDWTPGFSIDNQVKDFGYCFETAQEININLPMTQVVNHLLQHLQSQGRGQDTTAALFEAYLNPPEDTP